MYSNDSKTLHFCASVLAAGCFYLYLSLVPGFHKYLAKFYYDFPITLIELFLGIPGSLGSSFAFTRDTQGHNQFRTTLNQIHTQRSLNCLDEVCLSTISLRTSRFGCNFSVIYFIRIWFLCPPLLSTKGERARSVDFWFTLIFMLGGSLGVSV